MRTVAKSLWRGGRSGRVVVAILGAIGLLARLPAVAQEPTPAAVSPSAAKPDRPLIPAELARRERLRASVGWLAAAEREGRGPGTGGIDQAG
jgi:hypothetical protein